MGRETGFPFRRSPSRSDDAGSIGTLKGPQAAARPPEPVGSRFLLRAVRRSAQPNRRTVGKPPSRRGRAWEIVDDLPDNIPVKDMEIRVIETYFGWWVDEVLASETERVRAEADRSFPAAPNRVLAAIDPAATVNRDRIGEPAHEPPPSRAGAKR
jgi:hypothetical protein